MFAGTSSEGKVSFCCAASATTSCLSILSLPVNLLYKSTFFKYLKVNVIQLESERIVVSK